jgi:adenylate cyclase
MIFVSAPFSSIASGPAKGWPRRSGWPVALWSWTPGSALPPPWQAFVTWTTFFMGYGIDPQFERREAVRLLRLALSVDDDDPDTLATAAMISAYIVGDCERALEMADRAVALNPNSFGAWNSRGWVYRVAGLPEEAIRSFERAIRMSPVDPELHLTFAGMGMAFIELGRLTRPSLQERKRNVRPPVSPAYRCLAAAFALLGRDAEAREAAAHVLELDPAFTISALIARGGYSNAKGLD